MVLNGNRSCGFRFAAAIILRKYASYNWVGVVSWLRRWRGWPDATWIEKLSKLLNFIATEAHNIPLSFHHKLKLPLKYRNDFCTVREKVKPKQSIPYSLLISTPKWSIYRLLTGAPTPPLVIYLPEVFEFIEIFLSLTFYLLDREHNLWISFKTFGWSFDFISLLVAKSKPRNGKRPSCISMWKWWV